MEAFRTGRRSALLGGVAAAAGLAAPALAQPSGRPVRWVVGFPPGGASDIVARLLAGHVSPRLNQPVVVENRPGATTVIAAEHVVSSPADGTTVMTADMATVVYNRAFYRRLPYDPQRDFRPISLYARFDFMIVVNADVPARSVQELVALARQRPNELNFASPGVGSPHHLGLELLKKRAGIEVTHVPYRGAAPAVTDLVAGRVQGMVLDLASASAHLPGGRIRPLAVTSGSRITPLPDLPTTAEAGFAGVEIFSWHSVIARAATPDPFVARFNEAVNAALATDEVRRRLAELGAEPLIGPPERLREVIDREAAIWIPLIQELGLTLEM
jgi:tripartite-type tricarboxylate transporter receptor subunit TctC